MQKAIEISDKCKEASKLTMEEFVATKDSTKLEQAQQLSNQAEGNSQKAFEIATNLFCLFITNIVNIKTPCELATNAFGQGAKKEWVLDNFSPEQILNVMSSCIKINFMPEEKKINLEHSTGSATS
jgi:hypothetical protein